MQESCGGHLAAYITFYRLKLGHVHANQSPAAYDFFEQIEGFIPSEPARLGCADCRYYRGIKSVEVECKINVIAQALDDFTLPIAFSDNIPCREHGEHFPTPNFPFFGLFYEFLLFGAPASYTHQHQRRLLDYATAYAGVVEMVAFVRISQIGVCIYL